MCRCNSFPVNFYKRHLHFMSDTVFGVTEVSQEEMLVILVLTV